ncbi:BTB domain-containing protein [Aphelenchoides besseyi]|nr:BTB domain-containing protein [Aphelenchoides besseyi]
MLSTLIPDPNVAVWKLRDFSSRYFEAMEGDQWASEPYRLRRPTEDVEFCLQFQPKSIDGFCRVSIKAKISIDCEIWIENTKEETEVKRLCDCNGLISNVELKKIAVESTFAICFRFAFPVNPTGRTEDQTICHSWQMLPQSTVTKGLEIIINGSKLCLFHDFKSRGLFLCLLDLNVHSKLQIQHVLWIEYANVRTRKMTKNTTFFFYNQLSGWTNLMPLNEGAPVLIRCEIRLIHDSEPQQYLFYSYEPLFINDKNWNAEIHVQDKVFKVKKEVLSRKSVIFSRMFRTRRILRLDAYKSETIDQLLTYIYTNQLFLLRKNAPELLLCADQFQLRNLSKKCSHSILNDLTASNIDEHVKLVHKLKHNPDLKEAVLMLSAQFR